MWRFVVHLRDHQALLILNELIIDVLRNFSYPREGFPMGFLDLRGKFCGVQGFVTSRISGYRYPLAYIQRRALSELKNVNAGDNSILPVLIVGAGPIGLVLSILLTKLGNLDKFHFSFR